MRETEIPEGYKQTELGVIPNDWEVQLVGQCFEVFNNLRYPISEEVRKKKFGDYPYYGPTKIQGYIDEYRVEGEYALIGEDGDHFLKWRELSMTLLVKGKFNVNNHAHLVKGTKNLTQWFYYYFCHRELTPYLTRQGAGRYKLTKNALLQIPCVIPPTLKEQKAIAQSLSDVDALITECDRIITKKRNTKQGTMQQLLTAQKRLPGFSGEWEVKQLGEMSLVSSGGTPNRNNPSYWNGNIPWITTSQIDFNTITSPDEFITEIGLNNSSAKIYDEGTLLMAMYGQGKTRGKVAILGIKATTNQACASIRLYQLTSNKYVFFYLSHKYDEIRKLSNNGNQENLNGEIIKSIRIPIPPLTEQKAIAQILSDMDTEITALEQKRDKYKAIKQGMMQELLTGKTRLISSS
ncbi:type I restriction-modification enzyme S subunit [Calothrix sp. NIES-2100]|uniref:restriction endonuclease subunit S n=1 Tax=Calothrix sp. NIES-2100 TaxID=1954172 RepID=UPI000B5FA849|nr:type I restriction-modification enzyme S subunit [Calothrix sp. NIES-2100]